MMLSNLLKKVFPVKIPVTKPEEAEEELKKREEKDKAQEKIFLKTLQELKEKKEEIERSRNSLLNILEDISENEKIIKTQKKILDDVINYFIHGIILFDKKELVLLANQKVFKIFGIEGFETKENYSALKESKDYIEVLKFLRNKDLKETELSFNKAYYKIDKVVFEKDEKIDCLIILNDITKEKELQQAQSDFVALTAHQLRTPLSGIRWTLEMFLDGTFGMFSEEQKKYIKHLNDNAVRLIKVVNRFLDVTRAEQGKLIGKKEIFNMTDVINEIIKSSDSLLREKELSLNFDLSNNSITTIDGDREQLKIVIQNLLENAIKYTRNGSKIEIGLKNSQNNLIFSIKDSGYGIPIEEQEKIFTKFFRTSNIKKIDTEGNGLGLFVVKNIIEAHNGSIWFESEGENKGTVFYFTLKLAK